MKPKKGSVAAIGARIRKLRTEGNLIFTQGEAGEALGVSWQQFAKYEKGKNRITADALYKLSRLFRVKVEEFFT